MVRLESDAESQGRPFGRRRDWRLGGRSVKKWDLRVLAVAVAVVGVGVAGGVLLNQLTGQWPPLLSSYFLWLTLAAAVTWALIKARPPGLLRFKPTDLLWGLSLGLLMRLTQGLLENANSRSFPSADSLDSWWWMSTALPAVAIAPVLEELVFRGVLLVAIYGLLRRSVGTVAALVTSALASAGAFVLFHSAFQELLLSEGVQLFLFSVVAASLVILTGRIAGAILMHVTYNVSYLLLVAAGTILA